MSWEVIQGDCLDVMKGLAPASIDACITDPPYGTTACSWDSVIPFVPMWANLKSVVKKNGAIVLFGSQPFTSALVMSNPAMFKYEWVWRKNQGSGFALHKVMPMKYHENILVFAGGPLTYNPQETRRWSVQSQARMRTPVGVGNAPRNHGAMINTGNMQYDSKWKTPESVLEIECVPNAGAEPRHPTQKPFDLMRYLVRTYTNEGDTVLDFTCGSGSTGVACVIEGRNFIGIEQDAHYCDVARARIKRAQGIGVDIPKREKVYAPTPLFEAVA